MSATVDIKAQKFGPDDHAYRLFPGTGYKHYELMRDKGIIFLDYPGLPRIPEGGLEEDEYAKEAIIRAEQYAQYVYRKSESVPEYMAEIAKADLSRSRWSQRRRGALHWINGLYDEANIGDLVVVPGPINRYYAEDVPKTLVGQIMSGQERFRDETDPKYRHADLLVRRVQWLTEIEDRDLDHRTLRSLRTQNALITLQADAVRPVLGAAYKNVIIGDDHLARFITKRHDFTARESYHFQAFVLSVVAAYRQANGDLSGDLPDSIYAMAAAVKRGDVDIPEQDFSIHSPGYTTLKGTKVVFVVVALFAMAHSASAQPFEGDEVVVELENTASEAYDPCQPDGLHEDVMKTLRAMGLARWQEACEAAKAASEDDGLEPVSSAR